LADEVSKKDAKTGKSWKDIAEVRMVMYVVPVGLALALIGYILSQIAAR